MENNLLNTVFYYMKNKKHLELNVDGVECVERFWTYSSKDSWIVTAIHSDNTINIYCKKHYIIKDVSLKYFNWDEELRYF